MKKGLYIIVFTIIILNCSSCNNQKGMAVLNPISETYYLLEQTEETKQPKDLLVSDDSELSDILSDLSSYTDLQKSQTDSETTLIMGSEPGIPVQMQKLPCYLEDKLERYLQYKALNPEFDDEQIILYVNIGLDNPFYSNIQKIDAERDSIDILVNKYNQLPDNFVPELIELPRSLCAAGVGRQYLRKEAKEAFEQMHHEAKGMGLTITVYGTYRSIMTQKDIWQRKVDSGRSPEDVDKLNARGGHSEHHTGLAVDVIINNYRVEETDEFYWYKDHAHLFGFIIRYPKGQEHITGYSYEPWHLRYIGIEAATVVYQSGMTYEEYYAKNIEPFGTNQ